MFPLLNGLVLAGGLSSRMGSDKSLIDYHGKPQRERLFEMLQDVCTQVHTACREEQQVPSSLNPLFDIMAIKSPLNGILSAFHACPDRAWLAVAVDLPHVSVDVLKQIVAQRDVRKLATCFFDPTAGAPEPLLTIWEPAARPLLVANAEAGNISPRSFLQHHDVHIVYGMNESVFLNVNDPVARAQWQGRRSQD